MVRYDKQPNKIGSAKEAQRRANILCGIQNTLAAITGKSTVPRPAVQAGQNPRRSNLLLLGTIRGDVVYDAWNPTVQRFRRVQDPPEPLKKYSTWKEVLQNGGHSEEVDYILFTTDDWSRQGSSRDREVEGLEYGRLGCMLHVPMMKGYWCLATPRDGLTLLRQSRSL